MESYDPKISPWQLKGDEFRNRWSETERLHFLIEYAILAPSSHNTQPWKFFISDHTIRVFVDPTRWLRVADADQRELHISVGCALENLLIAAEHFEYGHQVDYFPELADADLVAAVHLAPRQGKLASFRRPEWFDAMTVRHTNHKVYEPRAIPREDQQRLQACCVEGGFGLHLISDLKTKRAIDELILRADAGNLPIRT